MTYALGRGVEYYDMPAIRAIHRDAARNNNRFSTFIIGIVKSVPFQMRRVDESTSSEKASTRSFIREAERCLSRRSILRGARYCAVWV